MQLTKTIFSDSAIFIEKKAVENLLWGKGEFLWARKNTSSIDTLDEESDTDESKDISDQDKASFEERLKAQGTQQGRKCCR